MEVGEMFCQWIESYVGDVVGKYFDGGYFGQVMVEKLGLLWYVVDCKIYFDMGVVFYVVGEVNDFQVVYDVVVEWIEK